MFVSGCPRFIPTWIEKKQTFQKLNFTMDTSSLNIAILMNKLLYRGDSSQIREMIKLLAKTATVFVKPHTRNMSTHFLSDLPNHVYILDSSTSRTSLIKGSDLSFFWGSSIGIEVIAQYIPFLYPKFVHGYKTIYEDFFQIESFLQ